MGLKLTEFAHVISEIVVEISQNLPQPHQWGPVAPKVLGKTAVHKSTTRRVYDILNGLEALGIVKRGFKHQIHWDVNECFFPSHCTGYVVVSDIELADGERKRENGLKRSRSESKIKKVERVAELPPKPPMSRSGRVLRKRGKKNQEVDQEKAMMMMDTTKDASPVATVAKMGTDFVKGIVAHAEYRMKYPDGQDTAIDTFIIATMSKSEFSEFERKLTPNPRRDSELFREKKRVTLDYYRSRRIALSEKFYQKCEHPTPVAPYFVCTQVQVPAIQSLSDVEVKF